MRVTRLLRFLDPRADLVQVRGELLLLVLAERRDELVGEGVCQQHGALGVGVDGGDVERLAVGVVRRGDPRGELAAGRVGAQRLRDLVGHLTGGRLDGDQVRVGVATLAVAVVVEHEGVGRPVVHLVARRLAVEERRRGTERDTDDGDGDDEAPVAPQHSEVGEKVHRVTWRRTPTRGARRGRVYRDPPTRRSVSTLTGRLSSAYRASAHAFAPSQLSPVTQPWVLCTSLPASTTGCSHRVPRRRRPHAPVTRDPLRRELAERHHTRLDAVGAEGGRATTEEEVVGGHPDGVADVQEALAAASRTR